IVRARHRFLKKWVRNYRIDRFRRKIDLVFIETARNVQGSGPRMDFPIRLGFPNFFERS
ncbi:MAG: hypothetical protein QG650_1138, partial [Patescibacteria group bacterium]|nr:hypothetical protein [Patescibacteria group bacterium]